MIYEPKIEKWNTSFCNGMSLDCKVKMSIGHRRRCRFWILFYLLSSQAFAHIGSVNFNKKSRWIISSMARLPRLTICWENHTQTGPRKKWMTVKGNFKRNILYCCIHFSCYLKFIKYLRHSKRTENIMLQTENYKIKFKLGSKHCCWLFAS